jgi:hemerythrin-like domain-containing protein
MNDPIAVWRSDHEYFRRLLAYLQHEVDVFHAGERPNYELMLDVLTYLRDFCDRVHHPAEDAAFGRLARRAPMLLPQLEQLAQEHRVIVHAGEALRGKLAAVLDGSVVPRGEVEVAAATYLVYYGNHIAKEEETVLPAASQLLTAQDWAAVRETLPRESVPDERFRALRRQIAAETS